MLWLGVALAATPSSPILHAPRLPPEVEALLMNASVPERELALSASLAADLAAAGLSPTQPDLPEALFRDRAGRAEQARADAALARVAVALATGELFAAEQALAVAEMAAEGAEAHGAESPDLGPARRGVRLARLTRWLFVLVPLAGLALGLTLSRRRRRHLLNPFVTGSPVRDRSLFVGRDALVEKLLTELSAGRSWTITGERRIGKTSLGLQVGVAWEGRGGVTVFVDLEGSEGPLVELQEAMAQRARQLGLSGSDDLLTMARTLAEQGPLLLMLDEVDTLHRRPEGELALLRRLLVGGDAPAVALLSGIGLDVDRLGVPLETLEVPILEDRFVRPLLTGPLEGAVTWSPEAVDRVVVLARGRPMRVQLLGLYLVNRLNQTNRRRVDTDDVAAVEGRLETSWAAIQQEAHDGGGEVEDLDWLVSEIQALVDELT